MLSACQNPKNLESGQNDHENRFDNNSNLKTDIEMYNEYEDNRQIPDCHTMCNAIIQDLCMDDIVELEADNIWYGDSIMDTDHCESICSSISDDAKECIAKAKKCDSIRSTEPYCYEEEDDSVIEYIDEGEENTACSKACYKYKECALMAADATAEDGNSAYNTCYQECQNWSSETINCMSNTATRTAVGCMKVSQCGLREYKGMIEAAQEK